MNLCIEHKKTSIQCSPRYSQYWNFVFKWRVTGQDWIKTDSFAPICSWTWESTVSQTECESIVTSVSLCSVTNHLKPVWLNVSTSFGSHQDPKLVRTARAWVPLHKPLPCHMCYRSSGQSKVRGQAQTPRVERQPHHLMGAWCFNGVDTGGEDLWLHLQSTTAEHTPTHGPQREFMIYHSFYSGYSLHVKYRYFITTHGERMYTFMQLLYMKNYVSLYWT